MDSFAADLRWISMVRIVSTLTLLGSITMGIFALNGAFGLGWGILLGAVSVIVLAASIMALINMRWSVIEVEESIHRQNFNTTTAILNNAHQKG
jgi:uncharacterized membrane protein